MFKVGDKVRVYLGDLRGKSVRSWYLPSDMLSDGTIAIITDVSSAKSVVLEGCDEHYSYPYEIIEPLNNKCKIYLTAIRQLQLRG